jgi:PleD family two-component response regulator
VDEPTRPENEMLIESRESQIFEMPSSLQARSRAFGRMLVVDGESERSELLIRAANDADLLARGLSDRSELEVCLADWEPSIVVLDASAPNADPVALFATLRKASFAGQVVLISAEPLSGPQPILADARRFGLRVAAVMTSAFARFELDRLLKNL